MWSRASELKNIGMPNEGSVLALDRVRCQPSVVECCLGGRRCVISMSRRRLIEFTYRGFKFCATLCRSAYSSPMQAL